MIADKIAINLPLFYMFEACVAVDESYAAELEEESAFVLERLMGLLIQDEEFTQRQLIKGVRGSLAYCEMRLGVDLKLLRIETHAPEISVMVRLRPISQAHCN